MTTRRTFLKHCSAAGSAFIIAPFFANRLYGRRQELLFSVHPFIENNPDAVFIMRTDVETKFDAEAIKQAGLSFGRSVLTVTDDPACGIPMDTTFVIKPNLTSRGKWQAGYTVDGTMGVITDVNFVEGIIERMKETGVEAGNIHIREVNGIENLTEGGYADMADRTGSDVQVLNRTLENLSQEEVVWKETPDNLYFKRMAYLAPVNAGGSWLLNIAKLKAHSMGLTLCAKNLQGTLVNRYQQHCREFSAELSIAMDDVQPARWETIQENYNRHVSDGIPRWNLQGNSINAGLGMETWATRCLDNNRITRCGLHVIEGIYGRDGNFVAGPHDGLANDFMTNVIIFGKNAFHVDIIGHWIGGHEPGNFGLFHMAKECGMSGFLNPRDIPLYEWKADGSATDTPLEAFERTPLLTLYMRLDGEDEYHMVDQPYDYPATTGLASAQTHRSEAFVLHQNYPNPFNPVTTIQYNLDESGWIRLEVFDTRGQTVDILAEGFHQKGAHMAIWKSGSHPSGTYFYRLRTAGFSEAKRMILLR